METIEKLKNKIFSLATEKLISVELSLKFLDFISKKKIVAKDAEQLLISLTTLSLSPEDLERILTHYLDKKITLVGKEEDTKEFEYSEDASITDLDRLITEEKKEGSFDYRERVYNYILTVVNSIDKDSFHFHYSTIKSENPQLTEIEFKEILKRAIKDNADLSKPYDGKTTDLDQTLDFAIEPDSNELKAFTKDYVYLIQDPASYMSTQVKSMNFKDILTIEEEKYYGKNLRSKEAIKRAEAKQKFTLSNLRLVMHVVKRFAKNDEDLVSLYEEGFLGLQKAIQKFDYTKNIKFSTYAIWWIRQAILRYLQTTTRTIRIPTHLVSFTTKLIKLRKKMEKETGEEVSKHALMEKAKEEYDMDRKRFNEVYPLAFDFLKIENIETNEWEDSHSEEGISNTGTFYVRHAEEFENQELSSTIKRLLNQLLTKKECEVIKRRYGFPPAKEKMTLQSIADEYGVSRERIRQIESSAQQKLSSEYVKKTLAAYFDAMQGR